MCTIPLLDLGIHGMGGSMRKRKDVVKFITDQLNEPSETTYNRKCRRWHYGKVELRDLLDYIYQREPRNDSEKLSTIK